MDKFKKSTVDFKEYSIESKLSMIYGGGGDIPTEGEEKPTPPPPPPPTLPNMPIIKM